jgi:hypothetical protein
MTIYYTVHVTALMPLGVSPGVNNLTTSFLILEKIIDGMGRKGPGEGRGEFGKVFGQVDEMLTKL